MIHQWKSKKLHEHSHQKGMSGNVILSTAGIYVLQVTSTIACPQDWAAKIHEEETGNERESN